jgi:hypothetical protein
MNYISQRLIPFGKSSGGGSYRVPYRAISALAAIILVGALMLAPASGFADQSGEGVAEAHNNLPAAETDQPVRDYIVWPLIFVDEVDAWRQFSFVPFYVERTSPDDSEKRVQFLWPIWMYRRSGKDVSIRLLPFFTYWKDYFTYDGRRQHDLHYMLFPIIYGSESPEDGKSFAFFPFGGK